MFFDTQGPDEAYQELLIAIAKKQRELLERVFDWKERKQKAAPGAGAFSAGSRRLTRSANGFWQSWNL